MYNQLFSKKPSYEIIFKSIQSLGYTDLNDHTPIPSGIMITNGAITKFYTLLPDFMDVYLPCKFELFCMKHLDINSCITITKQLLKTIGYDLVSSECIIKGERMQKYEIMTIEAKKNRKKSRKPENKKEPVVVSFS